MSKELEIGGLASLGGWLSRLRKHADLPPGTPCPNCETPLQGPFCHSCGQMAEDFHKSIWRLFMEVVESFTHFDGRLWRTLPNLVWRPGRLTRAFLDGKRTSQVPPFRMFLIVLLIAFFAGQCSNQNTSPDADNINLGAAQLGSRDEAVAEVMADETMTADEKEKAIAVLEGDWMKFGQSIQNTVEKERAAARAGAPVGAEPGAAAPPAGGSATPPSAKSATISTTAPSGDSDIERWLEKRVEAVRENPERFWMVLEKWAHRVAILALPVSALILTVLFVFQRRFYVFDHLVFSMHSLSAQLLLLTTILLLGMAVGPAAWWLILLSPVHLFVHMRGTYGTGVFMTLLRMWLLWFFTTIAFTFLALLWLYLGINEMGGS